MMIKKIISSLLFILTTLFFISCSATSNAGGSDLPNGKINVSVSIPDSLENLTTVTIKSLEITPNGEKVIYIDEKEITQTTEFKFEHVPSGNYIITATSSDSALMAISSKVLLENENEIVYKQLDLLSKTNIVGRVPNSTNCSVLIPGLGRSVSVDAEGFYTLNNVPKGEFEIVFLENNILSFVSIEVKENSSLDTLFIQDIDIVQDSNEVEQEFNLYDNSFSLSAYVEPKYYNIGEKPEWYSGKDFSQVNYLKIDTSDVIETPIWHFPIIAGVTKATSDYYGGFNAVSDSIQNHIQKLDSLFNIEGLIGDIRYTLDSVYLIEVHPDSEVVEPPAGFAVRLLYDGYSESTRGNWIKNQRVIIHNSSAENTGSFSDNAMVPFMWEFGLFRGCSYLTATEIQASKNMVNGTSFNAPATVMNLKSTTEWIDANIHLMNHSAGEFSIVPAMTLSAFPDIIGIRIMDYDNNPMSGIRINIYGVEPFPDSLNNIADFSGLTDSEGKFTLGENPFVTEDNLQHVFDNLLIEVDDGNNKFYTWLPQYKMYEWWFEHPGEEFYLTVNIL